MEDQSAGPDMEVYWREWRRELETHISILPQRYRVTVDLHYFEDLSYSEIAELLHQPPGTVKANVSRGIQLLRRTLETQMNETR
jgi:RNA polymerase sigma-70 factor (ECF subfamily)